MPTAEELLDNHDFFEILFKKIMDNLQFYRFYPAEVKLLLDVDMDGWVELEVPHLHANDFLSNIKAEVVMPPRAAIYPAVGDQGMLFFMNADPGLPKFLALSASDIEKDSLPQQTTHTLVKTAMFGSELKVDELKGGFTMQSASPLGMIADPEKMPLGEKIQKNLEFMAEQINDLWDAIGDANKAISAHIHGTGVGPSGPAMPPDSPACMKAVTAAKKAVLMVKKQVATYNIPGQLLSPTNKNN